MEFELLVIFLCAAADSPNGLTVERLSQEPRSFRVSWTPPASSTNLTGYSIYYSGADDSGSMVVGASTTNITIDNRKTSVSYTITIVTLSPHLPSPVVGPVTIILGENFASPHLKVNLLGKKWLQYVKADTFLTELRVYALKQLAL